MSDEQMKPGLEEWFKERDVPPTDVRRSARQVMERRSQVRQRSRWWPFPILYRRTQSPTTTGTIEYQPSPTPATDGHTPTVIGRTSSMLTPVKAIVAGALVFGIGGAFLIVQPIGRQDVDAPGAASDGSVRAPTEFTGHIVCGPEVRHGTTEVVPGTDEVPGHVEERSYAWQPYTTEMSDPRMEGDYYISYDSDAYASGVSVGSGTWRIENGEGAWQGSFVKADYPDHGTTVSSALVGEGDYGGLTAIWESVLNPGCNWDVRGVIIEGEPPAVPEPYVSE